MNEQGTEPTKAIVKVEDVQRKFLALSPDIDVGALIRENVGAAVLSPLDLDRLAIPLGGGTNWQVPTVEGEESLKVVQAIILFHKDGRVYWQTPFGESGGGLPPDCVSQDCITGVGNPGGICANCEFALFGSAPPAGPEKKSRGQACKQVKQLFLLQAGNRLPTLLSLPPTSLKAMRQFLLRLANFGLKYYAIVTNFALAVDSNQDGLKYSVVEPTKDDLLPPEVIKQLTDLQSKLKPILTQARVSGADYQGDEDRSSVPTDGNELRDDENPPPEQQVY